MLSRSAFRLPLAQASRAVAAVISPAVPVSLQLRSRWTNSRLSFRVPAAPAAAAAALATPALPVSLQVRSRWASSRFSFRAPTAAVPPTALPVSLQVRSRWTKAKKKRQIRWNRRQVLEQKGKSLPKPPGYFPKDTPVVNAVSKAEWMEEIKQNDEKVAAELSIKLKASQEKPVLRHHMTGLKMSDRVRKLFELTNGSQAEVIKAQKQRGMEVFQLREGDTGSSAVQVIALTTRIQQMQTHFAKHKKDKHGKRGMDRMYIRRRKLLDYMEYKDFDSYRRVVKTLGLVR